MGDILQTCKIFSFSLYARIDGFKITIKDGFLEVVSGSLVGMNRIHYSNLYPLLGTIVIGDIVMGTSGSDNDPT